MTTSDLETHDRSMGSVVIRIRFTREGGSSGLPLWGCASRHRVGAGLSDFDPSGIEPEGIYDGDPARRVGGPLTDVPMWVQAGAYAGFVGSVLWAALWFFSLRHSMARRGWKHTSRVWVFPAIVVPVGSASILLGSPPDLITAYDILIWVWLGTMVAGLSLDAVKKVRQPA